MSAKPTPLKDVRNVWAVGRNYADHAKELGNAAPPVQGPPLIFLKAGSSIVTDGESFELPAFSNDVHHELEVAFQFGADLEFHAFTLALDLTARDIQNELKAKSLPWTLAKSFRASCIVGPLTPLTTAIDTANLAFTLKVNGAVRQSGNTHDMIHPLEKVRRHVIAHFPVVPGDLLLTGTPAGVARLEPGDHLEAECPGLCKASWRVAASGKR